MDEVPRKREVPLVGPKLRDRVDLWVVKFDPAGVRVPPKVDDNRHVHVAPASPGMAAISGYLHAADGAALDQRLDALAATVCANDPRSKEQRRADAAKLKPLEVPTDATSDPGYRPSAATAEFIRWRDLTCR